MITRAASHTLLWKNPRAPVTLGGNPLTGWTRYEWWEHELRFKKASHPAPLAGLAIAAVEGAIAASRNVTITSVDADPETTPSSDLLTKFGLLRPVTLVCPERAVIGAASVRWVVAWLTGDARKAQPETIPETAAQAAVNALVKESYPLYNQAPSMYAVPNLILRHDTTAEDLGIVERQKITPDMVCGSVADDPDVAEAVLRWDRATPSTWRDLVRARLAAQERAGIPEGDRAPLYSGQVEEYLAPIILTMGTREVDKREALNRMRIELRRTYGELGDFVLRFMLRSWQHSGVEGLLEMAKAAA
jgi:hypothetical protein